MRVRMASVAAPGRPENEDRALRAGPLVGVLDGVTAPTGLDTGCGHGPAWYVRRLAARLAEAVRSAPDDPLAELLAAAIRAVRGDHGDSCDLEHPGTPAATVGLLRRRPDGATGAGRRALPHRTRRPGAAHLDYLILCDTTLVLEQGGEVRALTDARFDAAVAEIRAAALAGAAPLGSPEHAARLRAAVAAQRRLTNRPHGYWIAAADPAAAHHAITGVAPLTGPARVRRAALLTDGAACAVDSYGLLDWRALLDVLSSQGPRALIRMVRRAERADRDGRARPRYKRHDDATAVVCTFEDPASLAG
ncbi:MAG TPA: hypothetical protein VNV66_21590 [Pilimelia sp.]|nr:hypothetical protein [Pilimelia sp.]